MLGQMLLKFDALIEADVIFNVLSKPRSGLDRDSAISEIEAQGLKVKKISMKMNELESWCRDNDCINNSEARSEYAVKKLQNRARET
jgi:hypothetical protein